MLACPNYVAKGQVAFMVLLSFPKMTFLGISGTDYQAPVLVIR